MRLDGLNAQQVEAVQHNAGPCLVLATAGSGKTRVLTLRAARMIEEGVEPHRILLVTFTKKAAEEMRKRVAGFVGEELAHPVWIGTFHSTCLRMLKISYAEEGLGQFEVLAPGQALRLARDIIAERDDRHPYGMGWQTDPKLLLSKISRAKGKLVDLDQAERYFREHNIDEEPTRFLLFWQTYEALKREHKNEDGKPMPQLDFDDFLLRTYQLFKQRPHVLQRWQESFDFIMEDEVQDTMIAQHRIIAMLAAPHRNYFAVGDVQQSVYGFRGSDPDHTILSFQKDYPEGRIIKLGINYRSQSHVVNCGTKLIRHNNVSPAYTLEPTSHRPEGKSPQVWLSVNEEEEAEKIAAAVVVNLLDGHAYKDIAVLYRTNAQARALEDAMVRHQIPYVVHGSCPFYDRAEVKDCIAYVQLAYDPKCPAGDEALKRVINIASTWYPKNTHFLGKAFINELETLAHRRKCSMYEALELGAWKGWQWDAIADFKDFIGSVRLAGTNPGKLIGKARQCGYDAHLMREEGIMEDGEDSSRIENLDELAYSAGKFQNPAAFLDFVTQQRSKAKQLGKDQDAVQLLTIHRAKGLEWPIVYLVGVSLGLLPHRKSIEYFDIERKQHIKPESIEEERRLAYVGVTRAMDEVTICVPFECMGKPLTISPFVAEMGLVVPEEDIMAVARPDAGGDCVALFE